MMTLRQYEDFIGMEEAFEHHCKDLIAEHVAENRETRGFGEWVDCEDGLPCVPGTYWVRGVASLDGDHVVFRDKVEAFLSVEDYDFEEGEYGCGETYEFVSEWDVRPLEKKGLSSVEIYEWKQVA